MKSFAQREEDVAFGGKQEKDLILRDGGIVQELKWWSAGFMQWRHLWRLGREERMRRWREREEWSGEERNAMGEETEKRVSLDFVLGCFALSHIYCKCIAEEEWRSRWWSGGGEEKERETVRAREGHGLEEWIIGGGLALCPKRTIVGKLGDWTCDDDGAGL